ncbi:serine/threonine-protein phosphatase 2A 56 kDa regulatory subunit epsilon isoform isoform X2 [Drosophila teissieri]|uniref:serine/threonine-protein phosphatase 2A 56 kDa regulatory subunit epsilon isoform isoform X2 n=1 Tax=Drosophila teissieri TaxID=7243 RepID=UPI001CBA4688|nr:serine/threonine-protein phosphatase 2A 56 kDa regulatory subunit epsilon isoform isoform X2 [Drosophila teissieri]
MSNSDDSRTICNVPSLREIKKRAEPLAKKKMDELIIVKLLEHLDTKDVDDRRFLRSLLLRIYIKLYHMRSFMLKQFNDVFYRFIFEAIESHCIEDLLQIYYDIIKGYTAPITTEEEQVLLKVLLPLHKPPSMPAYYAQLVMCIIEFLSANPSHIESYVIGLLKLWPKTSVKKETLFLKEIASILVIREEQEVKKVLVPVFKQIGKCLTGLSAKIAEQTLSLWHDEDFLEVMRRNNEVIMPIVFPSLFRMKRMHLSQIIQELVYIAMNQFLMMNRELFESLTRNYIGAENAERSNPQ